MTKLQNTLAGRITVLALFAASLACGVSASTANISDAYLARDPEGTDPTTVFLPDEPFYLVGYSGGGGMATLVTAALPDDVSIDRLVLVAPAISPDYPLGTKVMPHVREYVVNYASERDLQVGWGTRTFGTIDRKNTASAGAIGFASAHERLLEYRWSPADAAVGHAGNHLAYLSARWQAEKLLPALDPSVGPEALRARWAHTCKEL